MSCGWASKLLTIPARDACFRMVRCAGRGLRGKANRRTQMRLEFGRIKASRERLPDEGGAEVSQSRARHFLRSQFRRRAHSDQATLSARERVAQENIDLMAFHRDSGSGFHRHRERPEREIHPTSVRKSNPPRAAARRLAWRAWVRLADSPEAARLNVITRCCLTPIERALRSDR